MTEPLSDNQLRSFGELADELEGDGREGAAVAIDLLLGEVGRLKAENAALRAELERIGKLEEHVSEVESENNRLRAELAELTRAAELGASGAFVAGMVSLPSPTPATGSEP